MATPFSSTASRALRESSPSATYFTEFQRAPAFQTQFAPLGTPQANQRANLINATYDQRLREIRQRFGEWAGSGMASEAENSLARDRADALARAAADEQAAQQAYGLQVANLAEGARRFDVSQQSSQEAQAAQLAANQERFRASEEQRALGNQRYDQQNAISQVLSPGGIQYFQGGRSIGGVANNRNIPYGGGSSGERIGMTRSGPGQSGVLDQGGYGRPGTMTPGSTGMGMAANPWQTRSFGTNLGGNTGPWDTARYRAYYGNEDHPAPSTYTGRPGDTLSNRPFMAGYMPSQAFINRQANTAWTPTSDIASWGLQGPGGGNLNRLTPWTQSNPMEGGARWNGPVLESQWGTGSASPGLTRSGRASAPGLASNTIRLGGGSRNVASRRPGMSLSNRFYAS